MCVCVNSIFGKQPYDFFILGAPFDIPNFSEECYFSAFLSALIRVYP